MKHELERLTRAGDIAWLLAATDVIRNRGWWGHGNPMELNDLNYGWGHQSEGVMDRRVCVLQALAIAKGRTRDEWACDTLGIPKELIEAAQEKIPPEFPDYKYCNRIDAVFFYNDGWGYGGCDGAWNAIGLLEEAARRIADKDVLAEVASVEA